MSFYFRNTTPWPKIEFEGSDLVSFWQPLSTLEVLRGQKA